MLPGYILHFISQGMIYYVPFHLAIKNNNNPIFADIIDIIHNLLDSTYF